MKVLSNFVLLRELSIEYKSESGLVLPESAVVSQVKRGEVIGIGSGIMTVNGIELPMSVSVGDVVVYFSGGAKPVSVGGEKFVLVRENDIYMVE